MKKLALCCVIMGICVVVTNIAYAYGDRAEKAKAAEAFKAGRYKELFDYVSLYAGKHDPEAQRDLCLLYWHGMGTPESTKSAISWCRKASEKDREVKATLEFYEEISNRYGESQINKSDVLQKLKEEAEGGDKEAQWMMYRTYDLGLFDIKKRNREAATNWLERAAENGQADAQVEIAGRLYRNITRDWMIDKQYDAELANKVRSYLEHAAAEKNVSAMGLLATFYQPIGFSDEASELPHIDYEKSTYWYRKAAEQADGYLWDASQILRDRDNPDRDFDDGLKMLFRASELEGNAEAKVELAEILLSNQEVPVDHPRAIELLNAALGQKYADYDAVIVPANYLLGMHYLEKGSSQENKKIAKKYLEAIFNHEFAKYIHQRSFTTRDEISVSAYQLAKILMEEDGPGGKADEAEKYLKIASEFGDTRAALMLDFLKAQQTGKKADDVKHLQAELNRLGYQAGPVDGMFGRKTFDALRAFECNTGQKVRGWITPEALESLKKAKVEHLSRSTLAEKLSDGISKTNVDCVRGALLAGADPNSTKYRRGPIGRLLGYSDRHTSEDERRELRFEITKLLIQFGSKVSPWNTNSFSAVADGDAKLLRLLLENGESSIHKVDGQSLMHWAAHYGRPKVMEVLSSHGAPPLSDREIAQQRITNAFSRISSGSGIPIVEKALRDGARINGKDGRGQTALGAAVRDGVYEKNHVDLIQFLLEEGADPNQDIYGNFRWGKDDPVVENSLPLNDFVMSNSASMNDEGGKSRLPAFKNARKYAIRAMRLLLDHGARVAGRDSVGRTPLHWAAKSDNVEAAKILLEEGAVRTHRDSRGATPLDLSESSEMISVLRGDLGREAGPGGKSNTNPISGSGFFVSELGHVVTNSHVVDSCKSIFLQRGNSGTVQAEIAGVDKPNDIALLVAEITPGSDDTTKLGISVIPKDEISPVRTSDVRLGEAVVVAGFPYGKFISSDIKVTSGIVSGTKGLGDNSGQFQLDAAIQPGNSGGPIYDRQGNVVGIVVSQLNKLKMAQASGSLPENTNFGIKAGMIRTFLEANGVPARRFDRVGYQSIEAIAKIAESQSVMVICDK